jgi:hypothetical protein
MTTAAYQITDCENILRMDYITSMIARVNNINSCTVNVKRLVPLTNNYLPILTHMHNKIQYLQQYVFSYFY